MGKDLKEILTLAKLYARVYNTTGLLGINPDGGAQITDEMFDEYSKGKKVIITNREDDKYPFRKYFIQTGIEVFCLSKTK